MPGSHRVLSVTSCWLGVVSASIATAPALSILVLGVLILLGVALLGVLALLGGVLFCRSSAPARRLQRILEHVRGRDLSDHHVTRGTMHQIPCRPPTTRQPTVTPRREARASAEESRSEG